MDRAKINKLIQLLIKEAELDQLKNGCIKIDIRNGRPLNIKQQAYVEKMRNLMLQ